MEKVNSLHGLRGYMGEAREMTKEEFEAERKKAEENGPRRIKIGRVENAFIVETLFSFSPVKSHAFATKEALFEYLASVITE